MAETAFVKSTLPGVNAVTGVALTLTACDGTNGNFFAATNTEILVVINDDTVSHTFTITGQPDPQNRTSNFSMAVAGSASITALTAIITPRLASSLWAATANGNVHTPSSNDTHLLVGVITGT